MLKKHGENAQQKELITFNKGFEAYNKKVMYGIDIISVLNKAIDNNRKYGVEYYHDPKYKDMLDYYVNVVFTYHPKEADGTASKEAVTYSLKDDYRKEEGKNIIQKEFLNPVLESEDRIKDFKLAAFRCAEVTYQQKEDVTILETIGRVKQIEFKER